MKSLRLAMLVASCLIGALIVGGGARFVSDEGEPLVDPSCETVVDDGTTDEGTLPEDGTTEDATGTVEDGTVEDGTADDTVADDTVADDGTATDGATEEPADDCADDDTTVAEETPEVEDEAVDEEEVVDVEVDDAEDSTHGEIVSTVAHCAPKGKDPRFQVLDQDNHGDFVKVAAHGGSLTVDGTSYDLSTLAGAEELCAALEALEVPEEEAAVEDSAERAPKAHGKPAKAHGKKK